MLGTGGKTRNSRRGWRALINSRWSLKRLAQSLPPSPSPLLLLVALGRGTPASAVGRRGPAPTTSSRPTGSSLTPARNVTTSQWPPERRVAVPANMRRPRSASECSSAAARCRFSDAFAVMRAWPRVFWQAGKRNGGVAAILDQPQCLADLIKSLQPTHGTGLTLAVDVTYTPHCP